MSGMQPTPPHTVERCQVLLERWRHQLQGLAAVQQRAQGLQVGPGQIAIHHQQHQVGPHGHAGGQASPPGGIDFINAGGVHQLNLA